MQARPQNLIGYSAHRCDEPRGQFYNWVTTRAMTVRGDGARRREIAAGLIDKPDTWTQFAGWSPDGRFALVHQAWESAENYAWEREHREFRLDGGWRIDCCVVALDSGRVENVTVVERVSDYNTGIFVWPGDPSRLGFTAIVRGESHPFSMNRDGTNKKDLTTGNDGFTYGYSASPDGKRISYHKSYQVYLADADGSNARHIDTGDPFHFGPLWSPDGQWIVFLAGKHGDSHPHVVRADGTGLRKLADRGGYVGWTEVLDVPDFHSASSDVPCWSADSRWVYCTARVGEAVELTRISVEGTVQQLTHSRPGAAHYHPQGSPDGEWVLFGSTRDGARALYVAGADGSDIRPITTPTPGMAQMHGHWQPVV
ncbi:MAG: PD40 domain-containing protein [Lentisphaerae bacterium]|nr:PD40 domain-containing protein [Lentisphaerota bacterium]